MNRHNLTYNKNRDRANDEFVSVYNVMVEQRET